MARIATPSRAQVSSTSTIIEAVLPNRTIATNCFLKYQNNVAQALPIMLQLAFDAHHVFAADRNFVTRFRVEDLPAPDVAPIAGERAMNHVAVHRLLPVRRRRVGLDRRLGVADTKLDRVSDHAGIHFASKISGVDQIEKLLQRHARRRRDAIATNEFGDAVAELNIIAEEFPCVAQKVEEWMALVNGRMRLDLPAQ